MYMGFLLPVLRTLERKRDEIKKKGLKYWTPLSHVLKTGVNARFTMNSNFCKSEFTIASCLHPRFKLDWLNDNQKPEVNRILGDLITVTEKSPPLSTKNDDQFFIFLKKVKDESGQEEL